VRVLFELLGFLLKRAVSFQLSAFRHVASLRSTVSEEATSAAKQAAETVALLVARAPQWLKPE
jgi:hypothetical protein